MRASSLSGTMMQSLKAILTDARVLPDLLRLLAPGEECYLVGGALRDWRMGRRPDDFDFATPDDPTELARRFAVATGGKWFFLDRTRRQSRVAVKREERLVTYDFAPYRAGDLEGDLLLRDFTINAMALPLTSGTEPGPLLDPLGGAADLADRRIRACSPGVLADDPLRILKGIRHSAALGFRLDEDTAAQMRAAAAALDRVAPERVRAELAAIFASHPVSAPLSLLASLGLTGRLFGPSLAGGSFAAGCRLALRMEEAVQALSGTDPEGRLHGLLAEEIEAGLSRSALHNLAAFLRGYAPADLAAVLARLRLSRRATRILQSLLGLPASAVAELDTLAGGPRGRALWAAALGPSPCDALIFLSALDENPAARAAARVRPLIEDVRTSSRDGRIPDLVDGRWLQVNLHLEKGPRLGKALELLRLEEVAGRVRTREDARKFLISLDKKMIDKDPGAPYNLPHTSRE